MNFWDEAPAADVVELLKKKPFFLIGKVHSFFFSERLIIMQDYVKPIRLKKIVTSERKEKIFMNLFFASTDTT